MSGENARCVFMNDLDVADFPMQAIFCFSLNQETVNQTVLMALFVSGTMCNFMCLSVTWVEGSMPKAHPGSERELIRLEHIL